MTSAESYLAHAPLSRGMRILAKLACAYVAVAFTVALVASLVAILLVASLFALFMTLSVFGGVDMFSGHTTLLADILAHTPLANHIQFAQWALCVCWFMILVLGGLSVCRSPRVLQFE